MYFQRFLQHIWYDIFESRRVTGTKHGKVLPSTDIIHISVPLLNVFVYVIAVIDEEDSLKPPNSMSWGKESSRLVISAHVSTNIAMSYFLSQLGSGQPGLICFTTPREHSKKIWIRTITWMPYYLANVLLCKSKLYSLRNRCQMECLGTNAGGHW